MRSTKDVPRQAANRDCSGVSLGNCILIAAEIDCASARAVRVEKAQLRDRMWRRTIESEELAIMKDTSATATV